MSTLKTKQKLDGKRSPRQSTASKRVSRTGNNVKPKSMLIVVSIVAVVFICVIAVVVAIGQRGSSGLDANSYNLVVSPDNIEEELKNNPSKAAVGTYDVSMNSTWHFKNAKSASSNAVVRNIVSNRNTVFFTVTRDDTGETILKSPYIPVGSNLSNIKLDDESLSKGTYPCTVSYHLVDDNYKEISSVNIGISVVIDN